ncbi:MAG: transglycosylase domain-containing protein [Anaerolineales bacterium]|nr:transglycosylase domain-containing protein [Anaerolineales bacterium]
MPEEEKTPSENPPQEGSSQNPSRFRRLLDESKNWEEQVKKDEVEMTGGWFGELEHPEPENAPDVPYTTATPVPPSSTKPPAPSPSNAALHTLSFDDSGDDAPPNPSDDQLIVPPPSPTQSTVPPNEAYRAVRTPPPPLGTTPTRLPPALDERNMPLPKRVDQIDVGATRVSSSAYSSQRPPSQPRPGSAQPPPAQPRPGQQGTQPPQGPHAYPISRPRQSTQPRPPMPPTPILGVTPSTPAPQPAPNRRESLGCLIRASIAGLFILTVIALTAGAFMFYQYYQIARTLPDVNQLKNNASTFETTRILDRNGGLLYEIIDPNAGRRTYVTLDEVSPYLIAATVATEDKNYYSHPGFDPVAIVRAFWQNWQSKETVSGASTITQQIARNLLFDPEERGQRTYLRKVREALLAEEITRRYTKDEVLELYLNENNYGNLAYGIEAAAETYFGVKADQLTLGQAAFLAGLPQAPAVYDIYTNRDVTIQRLNDVLLLMFQTSEEQNCIFVGEGREVVCATAVDISTALTEISEHQFKSPDITITYPHWVNYVRQELEDMYGADNLYKAGYTVYTTLDPTWQDQAQAMVAAQVAAMADKNAHNGALVAINAKTGEIMAMVGSPDFYNDSIDGQVNMAIAPRQPGSSIKPLTYVAAFEKGWTPSTLIWDVPSQFPASGQASDPNLYTPVNYDGRFHGPVTVRTALANSYNIPAVKALNFIGVYGDGGLVAMAERLGITTLTQPDYGLALTLGGGDVPLIEMVGAYQVLANGGRKVPIISISKIEDHNGNIVFQNTTPPGEQVIRPEHAYLISNILSDNVARTPMFGTNSVLNVPFPAAAKTGTTNDFRDNWTLGYTPDVVVGVWVGNADYTPMVNTSGLSGAAPIWSEFIKFAASQVSGGQISFFPQPGSIVQKIVCTVSGAEPSSKCPSSYSEIFAGDQLPPNSDNDLWLDALIDTWTGLRASSACNTYTDEKLVMNITDPWAIKWIRETGEGQAWAESMNFDKPYSFVPERDCNGDDPRAIIEFSQPSNGAKITDANLEIIARVEASGGFDGFRVEYTRGTIPKMQSGT